jgi:hypothetical protein
MKTPAVRRVTWTPLILLAVAGLVGIATYQIFLESTTSSRTPPARLEVDLERGLVSPAESERQPLRFPRRRLELLVILPYASAGGDYEVRVSREEGQILMQTHGEARRTRYGETMKLNLDFHAASYGNYMLELKHNASEALRYQIKIAP